MKLSDAWAMQARSDYDAALRLFDKDQSSSYRHTIAKYRQSLEKYVKGVLVALAEAGALPSYRTDSLPRERGHTLDQHFKQLRIIAETPRPKTSGLESIADVMRDMIGEDGHWAEEAQALCSLAPSYPARGAPYRRNSEYPFNLEASIHLIWKAVTGLRHARTERSQWAKRSGTAELQTAS